MEAEEISSEAAEAAALHRPTPGRRRPHSYRRAVAGTLASAFFLILLCATGLLFLGLTGKTIRMPVWVVAEVEDRLNALVQPRDPEAGAGYRLSVSAVDLVVPEDWRPRIQISDVTLHQDKGAALIDLPEARIELDPAALLRGALQPQSVTLAGARLSIRRKPDGQLDLGGIGTGGPQTVDSFAGLLDAADAALSTPAMAGLKLVQIEGLSLTLEDAMVGRRWEMGDGRLTLERRADGLAADLGVTLIGGGDNPARASFLVVTSAKDSSARLSVTVDRVSARDLALQAPPLAFLSLVEAPVSGRIDATLAANGEVEGIEGEVILDAGALQPASGATPVPFDRAGLSVDYAPLTGRLLIRQLQIDSPSMRMSAKGHADLLGADGRPLQRGAQPASVLGQIEFSDVQVDPEGEFAAPVRFGQGALDMRLTLDPFKIEIGQLTLVEAGERLSMTGTVAGSDAGWTSSIDVALDRIRHDRLMKLWPLRVVPKTRTWLVENVQAGDLFDVRAAIRTAPGVEPVLSLGYEFAGVDVRFLRTLPPIRQGYGRASVEGNRYVLSLDRGYVQPPEGGQVTVDGSYFSVPDITLRPSQAKMQLVSRSSLTATLSLLDQPPFRFPSKAEQPVDLGSGEAYLVTDLSFPLVQKVKTEDVRYAVRGQIRNLVSDRLVKGRSLRADALDVTVDGAGLTMRGPGTLDDVPFDVTYSQGFAADQKGKSRIAGEVDLSDAHLRRFGITLPEGMIKGSGKADIVLDLQKGRPGQLQLTSDLQGIALDVAPLRWRKAANRAADLSVEVTLGAVPDVTALALSANGLKAQGTVSLKSDLSLDLARFTRLEAGNWLDASVDLRGQGASRAPAVSVTGGELDLRQMPDGGNGGSGQGGATALTLDRVIVSDGIALTDFRGDITTAGGLSGNFAAGVNGVGRVRGAIVPREEGSAIRILSEDAGRALAAAGVFKSARGGSMDLRMQSRRGAPGYNGKLAIRAVRITDAPVLAELLSAISVIGLLEQLNGEGIVFNTVDLDFKMTDSAVEVTRGAAVGASMGVSLAGLYNRATERLDVQGVVSPFYLVNGIGAIVSKRGEGVFGINYRMRGAIKDPQVSVNPLSILTPGLFREIFRRPPPVLREGG